MKWKRMLEVWNDVADEEVIYEKRIQKGIREIYVRQGKRKLYMRFISGLQRLDGFCNGFDQEFWTELLDYATVY